MIPSSNKIIKNKVLDRFLPVPETVQQGLEPEPKITDFTLKKILGVGSFGRVLLVQHKVTQAQYAIKAIDKRLPDNIEEKPYFRREIEIMYKINHPNVVKLYGHFEDNTYCYFVMEYMPRGNLYSFVPQNGIPVIGTQTAVSLIKDVISALYYLHNMTPPIIHRDIKPENILVNEQMRAKLSDFGWSNYLSGNNKRTTICGTPVYLAPEIINEFGHDEKIDIWCVGVLLFELLTGEPPWEGDDVTTVKNNIAQMRIKWPRNMDPDARDIISKILRYIPEERPSWREIISHRFFTKFFPDAVNCLQPPNNSQHRLFLISKDLPLNYNNLIYSSFTNYQPNIEISPSPTPSLPAYASVKVLNDPNYASQKFSLPAYASVKILNDPNYSSQKFSMVPNIIQTRSTYTLNPLTSSNLPQNITTTTEYTAPTIINSITPQTNYAKPRNTLSIAPLNNSILPSNNYNPLGSITYNYNKINNSITQPNYSITNITSNNGYSLESLNAEKIKEMFENQERINELVRRTAVVSSRNKNYAINNDLNFSLSNSTRPIIYQTQYKTIRPSYYSAKNLNIYNSNNNLYSTISLDSNRKYGFSLSNNRPSYSNTQNYTSFRVDPEVLKWKEQERIRRESERIKISPLMNRYGMSLTPSYSKNINYI
jgi:aurora kinase